MLVFQVKLFAIARGNAASF